MKWWKWTLIGIAAVTAALLAFASWMIASPSGARWAAGMAEKALGGALAVGSVEGTIAGPLRIGELQYRNPAAGVQVNARHIAVDLALRELLSVTLHVRFAEISGVDVQLGPERPRTPQKTSRAFDLKPPMDVIIDSMSVRDVEITREQTPVFNIVRAVLAGHWTHEELAIAQLGLKSRQGEMHLAGKVGGGEGAAYRGEGRGSFRWRAGEMTYAGVLDTKASGREAGVVVRLTAPLRARVELLLEQKSGLPWRLSADVPRFDPRDELLPGSRWYSAAASINGEGNLERGSLAGELHINGEPLSIESLEFVRRDGHLTAQAALRVAQTAGPLRSRVVMTLSKEPLAIAAEAAWGDLVVPAVWAGRELHTRGELTFNGNVQDYELAGELSLGPAGHVADIMLNARGSPAAVELRRLDIVQQTGSFAARGRIDLEPRLAWSFTANADRFDPGAFASAWHGQVGFELASEGRITGKGPQATLELKDLRGELRDRALSGRADLSLTPALVPSGTLAIASGKSTFHFYGAPGEQVDAKVTLDVASLNDWLPDASGQLIAQFQVRGLWPELSIQGRSRARGLRAAEIGIETLALDAQLENPQRPRGAIRLDLSQVTAKGFDFNFAHARLSGGREGHRLALRASGERLALAVELQGVQGKDGWSGSLQRLEFDAKDAARLVLRDPARIELSADRMELSSACLADREIEICAAASRRRDGAMQGRYSLVNVPLSIAHAFTPADLPLRFAGTLGGQGQIRRNQQGEWFGDILLQSPEGSVARQASAQEGATGDEPSMTLSYDGLKATARLAGADVRAGLDMRFAQNGVLRGEGGIRGLDQAEPVVSARLSATLGDVAPLGIFVPQLAHLGGRVEAQVTVEGVLPQPEIALRAAAAELAADIPAVGLELKNGTFEASGRRGGVIELTGGVESETGPLRFAGTASASGAIEVNIDGDRFLAVDIPGARVLVTPDLTFTRAESGMTLSGRVNLPQADIDLQKLPRGERAQRPSTDVVVVDAKTRPEQAAQVPLSADVTVSLGEKVALTGFGLQAQLAGRLDVRERPGEPTVGSGEIRVQGKYKAYGQDLTIQRGRLMYAATPLDDPALDIEATRELEEVTAGLRIRGSARSPQLTVFSQPPMAQADALAYLVTGKPLQDIGADQGEADMMQTAARSLGTTAGGLLAKNVGRRLGVDDVAVKEEELIGGSALTVGEYLSPRLYLSYGVGLFEPGEVVTLRYELSRELAVQAQRGPQDTRAGLEYRLER